MEVARKLVEQGTWPLNSPPLFEARYHLPPGFYYLLAIPLLILNNENSIFIAFGVFFVFSIAFLWKKIDRHLGQREALACLVLGLPIFGTLYTHSAWNPALVMALSSILLGLFMEAVAQPRHGWLALPLVGFLLVQVHPSAAPFVPALGLFALVHPQVLKHPKTWLSLLVIATLIASWLLLGGSLHAPNAAAASSSPAGHYPWFDNVTNLGKWQDALLMPYQVLQGMEPAAPTLTIAAGVQLALVLVGCLLSMLLGLRNQAIRWVAFALSLWLVISMGFLKQGAFWHLDVIQPWLALLAAFGWARVSEKCHIPTRAFYAATLVVGLLTLASHAALHRHLEAHGRIDLSIASTFFPRMKNMPHQAPSYSYRSLRGLQNAFTAHGICQSQLSGLPWMLTRDLTNRSFEPTCDHPTSPTNTRYFVANTPDAQAFALTRGVAPIYHQPGAAIYAIQETPVLINGVPGNQFSQEKVSYMTYLPARHDNGLRFQIAAQSPTLLRVALRCTDDLLLKPTEGWTFTGARFETSPQWSHHKYLGSNYYDFEWTLTPMSQAKEVQLASAAVPMHCDVSAIARPAHNQSN